MLTPDVPTILTNIFSNLKETLGIPMTERMSLWVKSKHAGRDGLNVVFANFVETGNFIENILRLNAGLA